MLAHILTSGQAQDHVEGFAFAYNVAIAENDLIRRPPSMKPKLITLTWLTVIPLYDQGPGLGT